MLNENQLPKVLLLGATGQLGTEIGKAAARAQFTLIQLDHKDVDISNFDQLSEMATKHSPQVIINATAFHNLEECEANPNRAFEVNTVAVARLAQLCTTQGAQLLHVSTDYVFDGRKGQPYTESDEVSPLNVYGCSKAAGEFLIRANCPNHLIVRTSGLYGVRGPSGKGSNFIETMLRLGKEKGMVSVVTDQVTSPTYCVDLAERIVDLLLHEERGTVHITNHGQCSWFEFAQAIFDEAKVSVDLTGKTTSAFGSKVIRPAYSVLANQMMISSGYPEMRHWREALKAYLAERE